MKKPNEDELIKNVIKNGMYFKYRNKYYIKIGRRCAEMNVSTSILFDKVETEEIESIFNSNGSKKMDCRKVDDDTNELDKDVEE